MQNLKALSSFQQLILLFFLIILSWLITNIIGSLIGIIIWDYKTISDFNIALKHPGYLKYIQTIQSIGLFILPPIIFTKLCGYNTHQWLKVISPKLTFFILSIIAVLVAQPFISFSGVFNAQLHLPDPMATIENWMREKENQALLITTTFLTTTHWTQIILNIIIIAIIPAVGEELLFRGSIQKLLISITQNHHISILITAFLFSALHMQFFGFLPRFFLGAIFGYLFIYGGNLWLPIIAHFINNASAYIYYIYAIKNGSDNTTPLVANNDYPNIILVGFSIVGILMIILYFKKQNKVIAP
ncbi:CPBP family intramembrane glutamic endopeptidase [Plebeiibacterium marinum]|uniref:CPBP family intramembrane metalloprotease n=1 Tax=Plebeiibacterium marinum TaxID=2992111 RepID=A0AAE3MFZ2_9BACT|nr:CPBP family intramembrane glutamic endopeptidase [Plebeiobacterium marinum]MCW3806886.1 CPBP family intramembrane metalloprotease [Plebeiobacterium marinum]